MAVGLLSAAVHMEERLLTLLETDRAKEHPEFEFRVALLLLHIVAASRRAHQRAAPWAAIAASTGSTLGDDATLETLLQRGFLEQLGEAARAAAARGEWPAGSSCFPLLWKLAVSFRQLAQLGCVPWDRLGTSAVLEVLAGEAARPGCPPEELGWYVGALAAWVRLAAASGSEAAGAARARLQALTEASSGESHDDFLWREELCRGIYEDASS